MTICKTPTCNTDITQHTGTQGRQKLYCPRCLTIRKAEQSRQAYYRLNINAGRRAIAAAMKAEAEAAPPPEIVVETVEIHNEDALRNLIVAILLHAVRAARAGKRDAVEWLQSQAAQVYCEELGINPEAPSEWVRSNVMEATQ